MNWQRFSNPLHTNPVARIIIDRDRTNQARRSYDFAIIGRFDEPVALYRVLDGEELATIVATGQVEGGMFAVTGERAYGASWSTESPEELVKWGRGWQKRGGRLGKDLFVAKIQGQGLWFYHMNMGLKLRRGYDPSGGPQQVNEADTAACNTGNGCSLRVARQDAQFSRVSKDGSLTPMSEEQIRAYLSKKPEKDVVLTAISPWYFGGTILGQTVGVAQDQRDKLWSVTNRNDVPLVVGARTKKAAIDAATRVISDWPVSIQTSPPAEPVRLNRVPPAFEAVRTGQVWQNTDRGYGWRSGKSFRVSEIRSSYVRMDTIERGPTDDYEVVVPAKELFREFRRVA